MAPSAVRRGGKAQYSTGSANGSLTVGSPRGKLVYGQRLIQNLILPECNLFPISERLPLHQLYLNMLWFRDYRGFRY